MDSNECAQVGPAALVVPLKDRAASQIFSPNGLLWSTAMMTRVLRPRDAVHEWELSMTIGEVMTIEPAKPAIILSAEDYERLSTLAHAARKRMPDLADELAEESDAHACSLRASIRSTSYA